MEETKHSNKEDSQYLSKESVLREWGEEFRELSESPRVKFTKDRLEVGLKFPVEGHEGSLTSVSMIVPNAGLLKQLDDVKGDVAKALVLIRVCSGLPQAVIDRIKSPDFTFLQKAAAAFL